MANGFGIQNAAPGVQSSLPSSGSQAAEAASKLPVAPQTEQAAPASTQGTTSYSSTPAVQTQVHSKVVSRLLEQNATVYGPGLARVPLPARPDGTPRAVPKKPAGPMVAPRGLDGGRSPLAPTALFDARASIEALAGSAGEQPDVAAYWGDRLDALDAHLEGSA